MNTWPWQQSVEAVLLLFVNSLASASVVLACVYASCALEREVRTHRDPERGFGESARPSKALCSLCTQHRRNSARAERALKGGKQRLRAVDDEQALFRGFSSTPPKLKNEICWRE